MGKLGVVVHACHLSTWEVEEGHSGLEVSQPKKQVRKKEGRKEKNRAKKETQ